MSYHRTRRRILTGLSLSMWRTVADIKFYMSAPTLTETTIRKHLKWMLDTGQTIWKPGTNKEKLWLKTR